MDLYSNDKIYYMIEIIINDSDMRAITQKISSNQISDIECCLINKLYYNLSEIFQTYIDSNIDAVMNKIINHFELCLHMKLRLSDILMMCKQSLMKAGA